MGVVCFSIIFGYKMMLNAYYGFFCVIPFQIPWCPSMGRGWQAAEQWWPAACTLYTSTAPSGWWQNHILPPEEQKCHSVSELGNTSPILHFYRRELLDVNEMHNTSKMQSQIYGNPFILGCQRGGNGVIQFC